MPASADLVPSRRRILDLLLKSDAPLSVPALASSLGVSRNAAHQQVVALERDGLVERATVIPTKGRPSQGFRLSNAGSATFTRQYALLAKELLIELARQLRGEALREAMTRIGVTLAQRVAAASGEAAMSVDGIAGLLADLGYESRLLEGAEGEEIEAHNCVFHDLAIADPTICEVDLALMRTLSGRAVEHRRCMARGERSCRFLFSQDDLIQPNG